MSADGWLPPGVTDADVDRSAPGYYEPFYCVNSREHCARKGLGQCELCEREEAMCTTEQDDDERRRNIARCTTGKTVSSTIEDRAFAMLQEHWPGGLNRLTSDWARLIIARLMARFAQNELGRMTKPMEHYLGDGLYFKFDGVSIRLRAPRQGGDHEISLEPETLMHFIGHAMQIPRCRAIIRRLVADIDRAEQAELYGPVT